MVPLTRELLTIDYVSQKQYPLVFVTSGRLGSINHTLLSLEAMTRRGIRLHTLAYNLSRKKMMRLSVAIRRNTCATC